MLIWSSLNWLNHRRFLPCGIPFDYALIDVLPLELERSLGSSEATSEAISHVVLETLFEGVSQGYSSSNYALLHAAKVDSSQLCSLSNGASCILVRFDVTLFDFTLFDFNLFDWCRWRGIFLGWWATWLSVWRITCFPLYFQWGACFSICLDWWSSF